MSREKNAIIQSFNKIYLELIDDSQLIHTLPDRVERYMIQF